MARTYYHVAPRYTAGSPAMVDQRTAERVITQEQDGYGRALEGLYGSDEQTTAQLQGVANIVWTTTEIRSALIKNDLLTGMITSQRIKRDGSLASEIVRLNVQ